ncbi:MAG: response regulator transcription factor [Chloroflexota bacterium]|nr:MAG: response regulator transcription factor [Chloroflexota bacterium]
MNPIRLMLVDDNDLFRAQLVKLFESEVGIVVVGEASDSWNVLSQIDKVQPDIVMVSLSLTPVDGIISTKLIMRRRPSTKVIVLAAREEPRWLSQAIQAGAAGYLSKSSSAADLRAAVRMTTMGWSVVDKAVGRRVLGRYHDVADGSEIYRSSESLTRREREILELVGLGLSRSEIAERLGCSRRTVNTHLTTIFIKIGVRNLAQAAVFAVKHELVRWTGAPENVSPHVVSDGNPVVEECAVRADQ